MLGRAASSEAADPVLSTVAFGAEEKEEGHRQGASCAVCGAAGRLLACSKCKQAFYCSRRCQAKHWGLGHKGECGVEAPREDEVPPRPPRGLLPGSVPFPVIEEAAWRKVEEGTDSRPTYGPPRGLHNLGNSCYLNAALQGLHHGAPLAVAALSEHAAAHAEAADGEMDERGRMACFRCCLSSVLVGQLGQETPSASSKDAELKKGDVVELHGLQRSEMNGLRCRVTVVQAAGSPDRCGVQFPDGVSKAIQRKNLRKLDPRPRPPSSPMEVVRWLPRLNEEFNYGSQEDAHECLLSICRTVENEELREHAQRLRTLDASNGQTPTQAVNADLTCSPARIFRGMLVSRCTCSRCLSSTCSFETFMDLSLEITSDTDTVEETLQMFTATEKLDKDNLYKCEKCDMRVRVRKRIMLWEAPPSLVLHLKRFRGGATYDKNDQTVAFRSTLDLRPYVMAESPEATSAQREPLEYELRALVVHVDYSSSRAAAVLSLAEFGHYVSYVRCRMPGAQGDQWYRIDDDEVTPVKDEEVFRQKAYLLMYVRKSPAASPSQAAEDLSQPDADGTAALGESSPDAMPAARCRGAKGAMCTYVASRSGFCSACFVEEYGARSPADSTPAAPLDAPLDDARPALCAVGEEGLPS